jgi:hypothetical protein
VGNTLSKRVEPSSFGMLERLDCVMPRDRSQMTARVVPLDSDEAADARVGGSFAERLAILADLSRRMWALTGRPEPLYTRATMPVRLTSLAEQ